VADAGSEERTVTGTHRPVDRRTVLRGALAAAGGLALPVAVTAPSWGASLVRAGRPRITSGVASGEIRPGGALVWSRTSQVARMRVEVFERGARRAARVVYGPWTGPDADWTATTRLTGLSPGRAYDYRVLFEGENGALGEPVAGSLRTAPVQPRDVSFVWSGDTAGQGWGINPDVGGMVTYEAMRQLRPDFFIHSGDTVYSDGPISERVTLRDGSTWRNVVTPEVAKVAETLDEFRGRHRYNLLDDNVRGFCAQVPVLPQWDDHETVNNWWPGEVLDDERYTVRDVDLLAARARRAFVEYMPLERRRADNAGRIYRKMSYGPLLDVFFLDMRSYRAPNTANDQAEPGPGTVFLGREQLDWLERGLLTSAATWKVIAADMPLGLVVPDGPAAQEGIANSDGTPRGREFEFAELLSFLHRHRVRNHVWVTADVHYCAAHRYDPARAAFTDFDPFWEFVSGPLNAGTFGPNRLDNTFGPQVVFQKAAAYPNQPPSDGNQFFGQVRIAGDTGVLTAGLYDASGARLWSTDLEPAH
jgi:alkaline phosphatase D